MSKARSSFPDSGACARVHQEAEQYRDVAFGDPFTDYLTAEIAAAQGAGNAERQLKCALPS